MLEIPEAVYLQEPAFVPYDEEAMIDLVRKGIAGNYLRYSIRGITVDSRVAELLNFMEETGFSFRQAVDIRMKQVEVTLSACPQGGDSCLQNYLDFLRSL
jgi:hypothetical protein